MDHPLIMPSFTLSSLPFHYTIERFLFSEEDKHTSSESTDQSASTTVDKSHHVSTSLQHLRPTLTDSIANNTKEVTKSESQDKGHSLGRGIFAESFISRADVVAGVIVFSVGILVLVVAVTFYFVNGRSWRQRRKKNSESARDLDQELGSTAAMATVTTTTDSCHVNVVDEALTSHHDLQIPSPSESSPSTARLEDLPSTSVFSILKGSKPQLSSSMPTLTRTKARSSIKRKSRHRLFFPSRPPKACPPSSSSSAELTHVLCESLAAPDRALLIVPTGENLQTVSNLTRAPKQKESALALPHLDLRTLASGSHTQTFPSTTPSMMTTTTETHYSSSIMALYGSPKSSPNGSLADAASILAMYCPSMKSALSFSTSQPLLEPNGGPGGLVTVSSSGSDQDVSEVIVAAAVA